MKTIEQTKLVYERSSSHRNDKHRKIIEEIDKHGNVSLTLHNIEPYELFIKKVNHKYIIGIKDSYKYRSHYFVDTIDLSKIVTNKNIEIEDILFVFIGSTTQRRDSLRIAVLSKKKRHIDLNCYTSKMKVIGSNHKNIILGSNQDDIIYGHGGNDDIEGGNGWDIIKAGTGDDFISGGNGGDHLFGGYGNDAIYGDDGADAISGGIGADMIQGGNHKDYIEGNAGNDYISGDADNDFLFGGNNDDLIFGGDGDDLIEGDGESYYPDPEYKNNTGNDHILGNKGDDVIIPGKGKDFMDGGEGNDVYYLSFGDGANVINEVSENSNEIIFDDHLFSELKMTRHGSNLLITSKKTGDNLRVLVKDQISDNGPKIKWLITKSPPGKIETKFKMQLSDIFGERSSDLGDIKDHDIGDMLKHERAYGINKVSSIFNPTMTSSDTEDNLAMLVDAISLQEAWVLAGYSGHEFIPKNVANFITSLIKS
ncbi:putative hemolysin [Yersinia mollaretii]|uniref:calcium-binding protein n=1 Tax=Yersinia mollaretii TaxID=33060 RepID=UPI0005EA5DD7|nr:calcium-binding protein [Yersinia mollaretii]CNK30437.1 putative hemolysin [Yersinia mollaretii]